MAKTGKKSININKNEFIDRSFEESKKFAELSVQLETMDSILLLLDSEEETVLINALKHIVKQTRLTESTISLLKEKNLLRLLLQKQFFCNNSNLFVRRLALYLASFIFENINCLVELISSELHEIVQLSLSYYMQEDDDFCSEYLSVILNKCLDDPQCSEIVLEDNPFLMKYFSIMDTTSDPDILLNSLEILLKLLLLQSPDEKRNFVALATFPMNRLLCELNCEFFEIRKVILKNLNFILMDSCELNTFNQNNMEPFLLQQLTKIFCESSLSEELDLCVETLAAAMEHENMMALFFEFNLFDKYLERLQNENELTCKALWVFAQCAKCAKYLARLISADVTEKFVECLLSGDDNPAFHILLGMNHLMKSSLASKSIVDAYDQGLLEKILKILSSKEANIKVREQSANLLENLLSCAFYETAEMIFDLNFPLLLANVFAQDAEQRSIDLILSLLNIIETIAANANFRSEMCKNKLFITNIVLLLKNSFSNAILVTHLFRCLCCLVVEENIHDHLLENFLCSSIKRGLQSTSNQVKAAVTNFIMQTTRFPKFMDTYNGTPILEVLLLRQKHAFCVPTWQPAIESILSKNLTMKFCIRNSLGFTDITVGHDFMASKRKFNDFRIFQCILNEEVSPLHPVIVVNFNRPKNPENLIVKVPRGCAANDQQKRLSSDNGWCYCRSPGDEFLPKYLEEVNGNLEAENLISNPSKPQKGIDFNNLARRAKVIAQFVEQSLGKDLKILDLNTTEECSELKVCCHLKELCIELHCSFIPLGRIRTGCKFERAILFKALADQVGLPCTLQRSVDGRVLFNELPLPLEIENEDICDKKTLSFMPWRMLRPTHIVDLMYNVGELYPLQSRQALQYLRLF